MTKKQEKENLNIDEVMAQRAEEFLRAYQELVKDHGFSLAATAGLTGDGRIRTEINIVISSDGRFKFPIGRRQQE